FHPIQCQKERVSVWMSSESPPMTSSPSLPPVDETTSTVSSSSPFETTRSSSSSTPAPTMHEFNPMMPPFFANPFMSPFMPQQAEFAQPQPQQQSSSAGSPLNGFPPGMGAALLGAIPAPQFMMTPQMYQDMMQHYFQQMMVAAQAQPPQQLQQPMGMQPPPAAGMAGMPFPFPMMMQQTQPPSQPVSSPPSEVDAADRLATQMDGMAMTSSATATPERKRETVIVSEEKKQWNGETNQPGGGGGVNGDVSPSSEPSLAVDETKGEEKRKSSLPEAAHDERTTNLIRKQMNEMEKEINRRAQNKNVKKAALPFSAAAPLAGAAPKESLNQLRNSFGLPADSTVPSPVVVPPRVMPASAPAAAAPMQPMMQQQPVQQVQQPVVGLQQPQPPAMPVLCPPPPAGVPIGRAPNGVPVRINPFTTPIQHSYQQAVHQQQQLQQAALPLDGWEGATVPSTSQSIVQDAGWPDHSGATAAAVGGGGEMGEGANENEPVWVLRDSYMKKMQAKKEDWTAETVTAQPVPDSTPNNNGAIDDDEEETDRLLDDREGKGAGLQPQQQQQPKKASKETMVHEPAVLIEGVLFRARYIGSTQLACETRGSKTARMAQAQEAVARVKAPDGEMQPGTDIDLFISTEKIMVLNTDLQRISDTDVRQDILMDHALRTISYIADIGDIVVLMARRMTHSSSSEDATDDDGVKKSPKVVCHVFESDEAAFIAQSIGQAFQVAYVEFLRANGIDDPSYLRQIDYQEVLNSQELMGDELEMFARRETQKDVVVPKKNGEALGVIVVESGWGSMLPTVVLAHLAPGGPASRCNTLNVGDQIIAINGISLVGLQLSAAQTHIRNAKTSTAVRLTVVSTPPVVEVRIRRPDTKYQLGFSVQNGIICSLLRGGIAERGGIRVGHRIIEINGQSVVAVAHERIVHMLATAIGDIHMKTMPNSMFKLLTGQEIPKYI
ncbi:hypothetical protein PENTCL1PPCAC_23404, partial [Pristionchus entomophagus]